MQRAHEVEFKIHGEDLQFIEIMLDPNETIIAEAGAMMYMDNLIQMDTVFGDGSGKEGSDMKSKLFSAGKRMLTGESLFMTSFTNKAPERRCVAFAAPYPGRVIPFDLSDFGGTLICQKDAFLCAAMGISIGIAFQKKIGVGLFGGEGFIMQYANDTPLKSISDLQDLVKSASTSKDPVLIIKGVWPTGKRDYKVVKLSE